MYLQTTTAHYFTRRYVCIRFTPNADRAKAAQIFKLSVQALQILKSLRLGSLMVIFREKCLHSIIINRIQSVAKHRPLKSFKINIQVYPYLKTVLYR